MSDKSDLYDRINECNAEIDRIKADISSFIQIDVEYAPSAVGSSYSERYSNYEVTL